MGYGTQRAALLFTVSQVSRFSRFSSSREYDASHVVFTGIIFIEHESGRGSVDPRKKCGHKSFLLLYMEF